MKNIKKSVEAKTNEEVVIEEVQQIGFGMMADLLSKIAFRWAGEAPEEDRRKAYQQLAITFQEISFMEDPSQD